MNLKVNQVLDRLNNKDNVDIISKGGLSLVMKIIGLVSAFAISLLIGRTLGLEEYGLIELSNRLGYFVLVIALFGMENIVLKEVSIAFQNKNWAHISNAIYTTVRLNGLIGFAVVGLFYILTPYVCKTIFDNIKLIEPLRIILLAVFFQTMSRSFIAAINGVRKIWQANLLGQALALVFVFLIFCVFYITGKATLINAAYSYLCGQILVFLITYTYWFIIKPKHGNVKKVFQKQFVKPARRLLLSSGSGIISASSAIVILGIMESPEEVGLFNLASRLAMLTVVVLEVLNTVLAPRVASLYSENKIEELQRLITPVFYFLVLCGILSFFIFLVFGDDLVLLWGDEFGGAYKYLLVIAVGQFVNLSTGAVGVLLVMSNNEKLLSRISFASMIASILLNVLFISLYGGIGACIATMILLMGENIYKVFVIRKRTGVNLLPWVGYSKF